MLFVLCVGFAAGVVNIKKPRQVVDVDVGSEEPFFANGETRHFYHFFGFYHPEQWNSRTVRWSMEKTTITFPSVLHLQPLVLDIVLCGCRKDDTTAPINLLLNAKPLVSFFSNSQWRRYRVLVPPQMSHPDQGLTILLRTPTWYDGERSLGVAIDHITVSQINPAPIATLSGLLTMMFGMIGICWWRKSLIYGLLLGCGWFFITIWYRPQLLSQEIISFVFVVGTLILWWADDACASDIEGSPPPSKTRFFIISVLFPMIIAIWLVCTPQILGYWTVDDSFISFRYADQLIRGNGLVFNPGERVEGYTNFLWTIIIAGAMAIGSDPIIAATTLTMLLAFVCVALTMVLARQIVASQWIWAIPIILSVSSPFLLYTTRGSGMETALFTTLTLASLFAFSKHYWRIAGIVVSLTIMTRPDGVILAGCGAMFALWTAYHQGKKRLVMHYLGTLAVFFGTYFIWRWQYYGYLLPNTFYAKVGGTRTQLWHGLWYLWEFGSDHAVLFAAIPFVIIGNLTWRKSEQPSWTIGLLLQGFVSLFILYVVLVGGDWMIGSRFFVPLVPLLSILIVWGIAGWIEYSIPYCPSPIGQHRCVMMNKRITVATFVFFIGLITLLATRLPKDSSYRANSLVWHENNAVRNYREVGAWVNTHAPSDTLLAAIAGAMTYYADRPSIDVLGLADVHIAHRPVTRRDVIKPGHQKNDPAYVLGRKPQLIPWFVVPHVDDDPAFKTQYHLEKFEGPEGQSILMYVRNGVQWTSAISITLQ